MTFLDDLHGWLEAAWDPDLTLREWWARLAASGWSQPDWPLEWFGRGLARADASTVARAIRQAGALTGPTGFGAGMAGPTLLAHGTDDQQARHLPGIVDGTDAFCQLFSEPNAGSDLAGLQCRAERDGDEWVVNGQKVWTSGGQIANKAMLVARTDADGSEARRHLLLHHRHDAAGRGDAPAAGDDRAVVLQRGVPHRRPRPR